MGSSPFRPAVQHVGCGEDRSRHRKARVLKKKVKAHNRDGAVGGADRHLLHRTFISPTGRRVLGPVVFAVVLALVTGASLSIGANTMPLASVWTGLVHPSSETASLIMWHERVPRTLVGVAVGCCLGVSGALIQALTRNPLADPGILGVNAGSGFAVTLGVGLFSISQLSHYMWLSFLGAAGATVIVYFIGSAGGKTARPVTLVLAGMAFGACVGAVSALLTLINPETFRAVRTWNLGSIAHAGYDEVTTVAPFMVLGLFIAYALAGKLNAIALGDDVAASLGTNVTRTRVVGLVALTLLAGSATAISGGIGFIGLMVPHVVRWWVGPDQRQIMLYSAVVAPALLLCADVGGRLLARPGEIEVGIVTAFVGAPVLIALARRSRASEL